MKKYWYYIVILIVILGNISLVGKNYELNKKIDVAKSKQTKVERGVKSVNYLFKIAKSKYINEIESINVNDNIVKICFEIKDNSQIKKIVEDITAVFEKETSMVNVKDDKKLILEFE